MFGIQKKGKAQQPQDAKGGMIKGKGTGTSDDIKKNVESGSYIMPADSTQQIGEDNLDKMGSSPRVNLSNGEYQLTPNEVHSVGVSTLERMKDQTHTPVNQPQLGIKSGQTQPELFFANGGEIPDYLKRREQNQNPMMSLGIGNALNNGFGKTSPSPSSSPKPQTETTAPQKSNANFGLGKFDLGLEMPKVNWGQVNPVNTLSSAFSTANENKPASSEKPALTATNKDGVPDLLKRREQNPMMSPGIGNTLSSGFPSVAVPKTQATTLQNKETPEPSVTDKKPVTTTPPPVANIDVRPTVNTAAQVQPEASMFDLNQASTNQAQIQPNPYAIQQKGNSFSYANSSAAAQARAAGMPESNFSGGIKRANDPQGVQNFMKNTRDIDFRGGVQLPDQMAQSGTSFDIPENARVTGSSSGAYSSDTQRNLGGGEYLGKSQVQALAQREMNTGSQGYGGITRQPQAPQRTAEQEAELQRAINEVSTHIPGSKGLTAAQRNQIVDLRQGYANRDNQRYITDANNATSQQNNTANNATALQREAMGQTGQNYRTELGEQGVNDRFNSNLNLEAQKFGATNDLANRQFSADEKRNAPATQKQVYELNLLKQYEAAQSPEEKQSIAEKYNFLMGRTKQPSGNRFMSINGGQTMDKDGNITKAPDVLIDNETGNRHDYGAGQQQKNTSRAEYDALPKGSQYIGPDGKNYIKG